MRASTKSELSPQQLEELGRKINPAQEIYGPKDPNVEKWQKFFQDPINADKPIYRRKGFTDDVIAGAVGAAVFASFVYNVVDFCSQ